MKNATRTYVNRYLYQDGISAKTTRRWVSSRPPMAFYLFLAWTFVLIGRPQDIFTHLGPLRPAFALGLITIFSVLIQRSRFKAQPILKNTQVKFFATLVCVMFLSVPFAYYPSGALNFLATVYINIILFFIVFYKITDSPRRVEQVLLIICIGTALYSFSALQKGVSVGVNRLSFGTVFDPNDLAYFTVSLLPFNFLFFAKTNPLWQRFLCSANIAMSVLLVLRSGSRGGIIGLGVIIFLMLFMRTHTIRRFYKIIIVVMVLIVISLGASVIDFSRLTTVAEIQNDYNMWDETGRIEVWKKGLGLMLSHPFTGVGIACFNEAIGRERVALGLQDVWQAPHNPFVQIGAETGVLGLILFALMSAKAFMIFIKVRHMALSDDLIKISEMAMIGFAGQFVSSMFLSQAYSIYWSLYIVLSAVLYRMSCLNSALSQE